MIFSRLKNLFDQVGGDGEADVFGVGYGYVDAYYFALQIDQWAAGITWVDGGIGLNHTL